jgi:hypothetical protein
VDDPNVITAVFGLTGVIIGGILSGLVQLWMEVRRNRAAGQAAAALISEELLTVARRSSAFLVRQVDWEAVVSTDAWDAYRTEALLALPQELGYVLVTTYGVVDNAQRATRKHDRDRVALALSRVAELTGRALLLWRRSGEVEDDLIRQLERGIAEADALFAQLREIKALETEERILLGVRRWVIRASDAMEHLSK